MTVSLARDIWREVAIQPELDISLPNIYERFRAACQATGLVVRRLAPSAAWLQTIACSPGQAVPDEGKPCPIADIDVVLNWFLADELLTGDIESLPPKLAVLVPPGLHGTLIVAPLKLAGQPVGVLISQHPRRVTEREQHVCRCLQEPLATALANHQQIHELRNLREKVEADNRSLLSRLDRQDISESIIGEESGLKTVCERIDVVGGADVPVLLLGETGSGKEVVARALHMRSRRVNGPFLRVNCGAIPPELIDSHLFGHERGSFSGADSQRKGWFERADGGTLFLDEIGDLPQPAQVRLLRVLQDGTFERVGGQRPLTVDVRIIAATHRDLRTLVATGTFREDLWYRIAVFPIQIPPLRERMEDIPVLANHFALRAAKRLGTLPLNLGPEDNRLLMNYDWPGNVRELAAVMERAVILGNGRSLEVGKALGLCPSPGAAIPAPQRENPADGGTLLHLDEAMARHIERALALTGGRVEGRNGAARLLAVNPHTLRARMRRLNIDWKTFRDG
jgi:transcriptional regulator with GAF, ATPase, and Fis domain